MKRKENKEEYESEEEEYEYEEEEYDGKDIPDENDEEWEDDEEEEEIDDDEIFANQSYNKWFRHLVKEYPTLTMINFDRNPADEEKFYLLYGKIQSGKTGNIIALCHLSQINGYGNLVILPNNSEGYLQFKDRVGEYNSVYEDFCLENGIQIFHGIRLVFAGNTSQKNINLMRSVLANEIPGTIVTLGNAAELKLISDLLDELEEMEIYSAFNVIVDEADTAYKKESTAFRPVFDKILDYSSRIIGVSATTFKLWFMEERVITTNVMVLRPNEYYRGIKDFSLHYIDDKNTSPKRSDHALVNDEYLDTYLKGIKKKPIYRFIDQQTGNLETHPHILLYKSSEILNDHHLQIQEHVREHHSSWVSIVFNGDGIRLFSEKLLDVDEIIVNDITIRRKGKYYQSKEIQLKHILEYLRENGDAETYPHIIIISGKLANRMISFVSSSYRWHLTNMYMLANPKGKTSCDDLLQMCRLCGVYKYDKIPLEFASHKSVCNDLMLADKVQEKIIKSSSKYALKLKEYVEETHEVDEEELPKRILVKNVKYKLNVVVNDSKKHEKDEVDLSSTIYIDSSKIRGKVEKELYVAMAETIKYKNQWIPKKNIINKIVENYGFANDRDQLNGNLNSMIRNKSVNTKDENRRGLLLRKIGDNWLVRHNE